MFCTVSNIIALLLIHKLVLRWEICDYISISIKFSHTNTGCTTEMRSFISFLHLGRRSIQVAMICNLCVYLCSLIYSFKTVLSLNKKHEHVDGIYMV